MLIVDVIREADNEHEIYFLLTAYVEAVRHCDPLHHLPEIVRELPFNGVKDVSVRAESLRAILESPETLDDKIRLVLAEALGIFAVARHRLEMLREEELRPLLEAA
jgi:hypothetical protein